jgi:hypothetical protein
MNNITQQKGQACHGLPSTTSRPNSTKNQWNYKGGFDRARLPLPAQYFITQDMKLTGHGAWRDAVCPFHTDTKPSLRIRLETGAFKCMVCGAHGGDILAFHMQRYGLNFKAAAVALGAWIGGAR